MWFDLSDVKCLCWTYPNVSCTNVVDFILSDCISHLAIPPLLPLTENLAACSPKIWRRNRLMRASRVLGQAPKPQNCKTISNNMTCMLSFFHFFHHLMSAVESCPNEKKLQLSTQQHPKTTVTTVSLCFLMFPYIYHLLKKNFRFDCMSKVLSRHEIVTFPRLNPHADLSELLNVPLSTKVSIFPTWKFPGQRVPMPDISPLWKGSKG